MSTTGEPSGSELELRELVSKGVDERFHDIRKGRADLHDPDDYSPSQSFARALREEGSNGIVYRSVRHESGTCLAVLRPKAIPRPKQGAHLRYRFDGERIDRWFRMGEQAWRTLG